MTEKKISLINEWPEVRAFLDIRAGFRIGGFPGEFPARHNGFDPYAAAAFHAVVAPVVAIKAPLDDLRAPAGRADRLSRHNKAGETTYEFIQNLGHRSPRLGSIEAYFELKYLKRNL